MIDIHLTESEVETLHKILDTYLSDLRVEIADTDSKDFRDILKSEEMVIKEFLHRLENTPNRIAA